jgi:hypothetical protein
MRRWIALSAALPVLLTGCPGHAGNPAGKPDSSIKPIVDIPKLTKRTPQETDKILGRPTATSKNRSTGSDTREYPLRELKEPLWIEFGRNDRASLFILTLPRPAANPVQALQWAGLDLSMESPDAITAEAAQWDTVRRENAVYSISVQNTNGGWTTMNVEVKW